jgi:long-chain acyl-CoA synthetase
MAGLGTRFLAAARKHGSRLAVSDETGAHTYAALARRAQAVARALDERKAGDRVGMLLPADRDFPACFFGVVLSGRVPVPLDYLLPPMEMAAMVADAGVETVLGEDRYAALGMRKGAIRLIPPAAIGAGGTAGAARARDRRGAGVILFTSGTCDMPRGVAFSHANLVAAAESAADAMALTEADAVLGTLPLVHAFALNCTMLMPLLRGAGVHYRKASAPRRVLEDVERARITLLVGTPSMYRLLIRAGRDFRCDLSSVRLCVAGGESLGAEVRAAFRERFRLPLYEGYGLSEAGGLVTLNVPGATNPDSAGRPIRRFEVRIVDEAGRTLGPGKVGRIAVRGPGVMRGYHGRPELTAKVLRRGWLLTADAGRLDADGYLTFVGRREATIRADRQTIYAEEIERVLLRHPSVEEASVVGVRDASRGEVPKAFVVLKEGQATGAEALRDYLQERLAACKVPRYVEFRDSLPRSAAGRVLKRLL